MVREEMPGVSPGAFQSLQDRMAEGSSKAAKKGEANEGEGIPGKRNVPGGK